MTELETVNNNIKLLTEMLTVFHTEGTGEADKDIMKVPVYFYMEFLYFRIQYGCNKFMTTIQKLCFYYFEASTSEFGKVLKY